MMFAVPQSHLARLRGLLAADALVSHAARLGVGTVVAFGISLAATPVLARCYGPEAFGLLALFTAMNAVSAIISTGRYEQAIALPAAEADAVDLVRLCRCTVLGGSTVALALFPVRHAVAGWFGRPDLAGWLWALPLTMWLSGSIQTGTAWAIRRSAFAVVAGARVALALATAALQIGLLHFAGPTGLLLGLIGGLGVQHLLLRRVPITAAPADAGTVAKTAQERRHFPLYVLPAALVDVLTLQIPVFLGGAWFGVPFVGFYTAAARLTGLPATLIGAPFAQVFYQDFSRRTADPPAARAFLFRTWLKLALLGGLPLLGLALWSEPICVFVLGAAWRPAGAITGVLCPMYFAMFVSSPTSGALLALGGQRLAPLFSVSSLVSRITGFWLGARIHDYLLGLALVGVAEIVTIVVYNGLILRRLHRGPT
jgi:O-antigen/teichoic acid export membrane protein